MASCAGFIPKQNSEHTHMKKNQPLRHATQLLHTGQLEQVDVTIMSLFFWGSWGNGRTRARWSVARLASTLSLSHWQCRKALARLQRAGLIAQYKATRLARQGHAWVVLGKAAFRKQRRAKARKPCTKPPRPRTLAPAPVRQPEPPTEPQGPPIEDLTAFFTEWRATRASQQ